MTGPADQTQSIPVEPIPDAPAGDWEQRIVRHRALIAAVVSLAVVVVVVVASIMARRAADADVGVLAVAGTDQPGAGTAACTKLTAALPDTLAGQARRTLADPAPTSTAGWGDPAAVYRCGVPTPDQLTCSAHLLAVNGVQWLAIAEDGDVTYLTADRQVRVALTIPDGFKGGDAQLTIVAPAAVTELSNLVARVLPARAVCDGNAQLLPTDGGS